MLAVIGRNGAGKSTLCRVLNGVLPPEAGRVIVRGRLNLLTPGIGFSATLTGRENIMLGGLANGLSPERLAELSEEIGEFAQLDEYLDLPMHAYSGGHAHAPRLVGRLLPRPGDPAHRRGAHRRRRRVRRAHRREDRAAHRRGPHDRARHPRAELGRGRWRPRRSGSTRAGSPSSAIPTRSSSKYMRYCRIESLNDGRDVDPMTW